MYADDLFSKSVAHELTCRQFQSRIFVVHVFADEHSIRHEVPKTTLHSSFLVIHKVGNVGNFGQF